MLPRSFVMQEDSAALQGGCEMMREPPFVMQMCCSNAREHCRKAWERSEMMRERGRRIGERSLKPGPGWDELRRRILKNQPFSCEAGEERRRAAFPGRVVEDRSRETRNARGVWLMLVTCLMRAHNMGTAFPFQA